MSPHSHSDPSAETLFAAWLARHEAGEDVDFEALCKERPAAASELRELHSQWARVDAIRRQCGLKGSILARIETRFGPGVDPQVSLERELQGPASFSSEVLSRLAGRTPASTRYRVHGEVAHGGMGAVLRVWDEDLRRHLAMKVMLGKHERGPAPQSVPRLLARFLEEAQVTGQLDHPGIVPVHELGLDAEGRVYFTMKLVKGVTLHAVFDELARGAHAWTQVRVLGLILKVCEAMSYAHAKGVIHRDLKPDNVMVGAFGEVYVMDWGLAKVLGRDDEKDIRLREEPGLVSSEIRSERRALAAERPDAPLYTMDGDVVGTPAYMSPEQAHGDLAAMGAHSDVYAVGAMLYHLLAGHMPYVRTGGTANNYAIWRWVREGPPAPLDKVAPGASVELVAICERAMARERERRYADMAALSGDLSAYVEGRVVRAYETGAWAEARKWVQRNRPLAASLAAAVVLTLCGLAGIGYVQTKGRDAERVQSERANAKALEAERNAEQARANLVLAQENERLARAETAKVLRLSDVKVLQELKSRSDALWPAHPDKIPELESWVLQARSLVDNLPGHRATLLEMRAGARGWSDEERARDRESHPRASKLAAKQVELDGLIAQLEQGLTGEAGATAEQRVAELESEVAALGEELQSRRTWTFETTGTQWQHDVLAELVADLELFEASLLAEDALVAGIGWSIPRRLSFARDLAAGFAEGGWYAEAWEAALPALRAAYPDLDLTPQMGLLPIGPDPASGLWEFAHLMTGEPAERARDGKLILTAETGAVLVLLRGGTFWMGSQAKDPQARNYDPQASDDERPVHEVALSPYFISKYELTQGQWLHVTGASPSIYPLDSSGDARLHPVEQVSWLDCTEWLPRAGLALPSEAQWECAARGGTETPWWTGSERESLREQHAVNLADQTAARTGVPWESLADWPELDDGFGAHAPVGTFAPNPFGLHEVAGNLWELCLDGYDVAFYLHSPSSDPVSPWKDASGYVTRGGSFSGAALHARSAVRLAATPYFADSSLGVRPVRSIERQ
jgi:formylglycine-generating enzyme required for sulfatase activity/serine/threonine protein kinase